jgi:hypothetical protein
MRLCFSIGLLLSFFVTRSQILSVGSKGLMVRSGTVFHVSGLTLQPTVDFLMKNQNISLNNSLSNTLLGSHVRRVYRFSNSSAPFYGSVNINYNDSELNGHQEGSLEVHVHNGSNWRSVNTVNRNTGNNTVTTDQVMALSFKEITLASPVHPELQHWINVLGNPVRTNRAFLVNRLSANRAFSFYTIDGKLLQSGTLRPGLNLLPVSSYANGIYILRCQDITEKIIIQR